MLTILIFIIILGVLIFVHELGHFITARRSGIKAEEFGFGFPPRLFGFVRNEKTGKFEFVPGNKEVVSSNTVYSINWIPLGGFVKIKGENGDHKDDPDSFGAKKAGTRAKVLSAGVIMNFVLAWALISIILTMGAPEQIENQDGSIKDSKIQISEVVPGSPAETMGFKVGDEILKSQKAADGRRLFFKNVGDVQEYIGANKGKEITFIVKRGEETINMTGTPRQDIPAGQGPLGISLAETVLRYYSWYEAIWKGLVSTLNLIWTIILAFGGIIKSLFMGNGVGVDVSGPVGIAVLTKQVASLGLIYIFQFAAILSINLGIINALPFPGLDGGRVLFILIEKIKGSPVSQRVESVFHTVGFVLLILLMVLVTFRDVLKLVK